MFRSEYKPHENVQHSDIRQLDNLKNMRRRIRRHETGVLFEKEMHFFVP